METLLGRYRNIVVLVAVLFAQVLTLAYQIRRNEPTEGHPVRLIRLWTLSAVTPLEKAVVGGSNLFGDIWHNYFWLRGVRKENAELRQEMEHMRLEEVRLVQDAAAARRLQLLLGFKEQFISQTVAAQVIGTSGSELSRIVTIDKGRDRELKPDMAVISPDGIVGKVIKVFPSSAQVLLINDASSGAGAILSKSRLQGILNGTAAGELQLRNIMADEKVELGDAVITSGGDRVFPKGLPIGTVTQVSQGPDFFLNIRVRPAAQIARLEEVLVITKIEEKPIDPSSVPTGPVRAADILAARLPTLQPGASNVNSKGIPLTTAELAARERAAKKAAETGGAATPGVSNTTPPANRTTGAPPSTAEFLRQQKQAQPPAAGTPPPGKPNQLAPKKETTTPPPTTPPPQPPHA